MAMKNVTLKTEKVEVGPNENRKPPVHTIYEDDKIVLQTYDFVYAFQAYLNRMANL